MRVVSETLCYNWREMSIDNNTNVTLDFLFMHKEIKFTFTTSLQHGIVSILKYIVLLCYYHYSLVLNIFICK